MKTVKMLVELTYDNDMMHEDDADGIAWFNDEVLGGEVVAWSRARFHQGIGDPMSDVEQYWEAIRKRWPHPTPSYQQLDPMEQMMLVQSVNILLQILNNHQR